MSASNAPKMQDYDQFLASKYAQETNPSLGSHHLGDQTAREIVMQFARYGLLKFGAQLLWLPINNATVLREVQAGSGGKAGNSTHPSTNTNDGGGGGIKCESDGHLHDLLMDAERGDALSKAHKIKTTRSQPCMPSTPCEITKDPRGYLTTSKANAHSSHTSSFEYIQGGSDDSIHSPSSSPHFLSKKVSIARTVSGLAKRNGFFSLWSSLGTSWTLAIMQDLCGGAVEEALDYHCNDSIHSLLPRSLADYFYKSSSAPSTPFVEEGESGGWESEVVRPALIASVARGLVAFACSPLALLKVRLQTQSIFAHKQTYRGTIWSSLKTIVAEEGPGLGCLFPTPILSFTCAFLGPFLRILPVSMLNYYWRPASDSMGMGVAWMALQNAVMCAGLLVQLPLECIQARMQAQRMNHLNTRVPLNNDYTGTLNCAWRIWREEGIHAFYQGWGVRVAGVTFSFVAALIAEIGGDGDDAYLLFEDDEGEEEKKRISCE